MYATFFGLRQSPFSIAPDPRYLFMSERHREALAHLLYGVGGGGGFVLLSGEIGAGKTTVCRCFLEQVPATCQVAYIFNPKLTVIELLQTVCDEFGVAVVAKGDAPASVKPYIDALNAHLLAAHAQGRQCVLVIDEAQNLSADVLEQLRLLTNLETAERKLLQIILIGQPELRQMLASPGLEQLAQRVIARYHLGALSAAETAAYVAHRLAVGGLSGPLPFGVQALRRIHQLSGGVPRRINLLADRAMLGAYGQGQAHISAALVDRAAGEVFDDGLPRRQPGHWRWAWAAALAVITLAGLAAAWWWRPGAPVVLTRPASGPATAASAAASAPASAPATAPASAPPLAAASSALPASATAPAQAVSDLSGWLAALPGDDQALWPDLLPLWGLDAGTPVAQGCPQLADPAKRCYRSVKASWAQLRQMDRPGLLVLRDAQGQARFVHLAGLGSKQALLQAQGRAWRVPLEALTPWWRGEFATLWLAPPSYQGLIEPGAQGPAVDALAQALAAVRDEPAPAPGQRLVGPLAARLAAFQRAQGLAADGVAGPTTFMQLMRLRGQAEPRLSPAPQEP